MAHYNLPLEWIYLHHKGARVLTPYLHRVAELVCQGQLHAQYFYGFDPHTIITPCGIRHVEKALILNKNANSFFPAYYAHISKHNPAGKLLDFLQKTELIFTNSSFC